MTPRDSATGGPSRNGDGRWEDQAAAVAKSVRILRAGVVAFAARHGAPAALRGDIALAASEALTNAVTHAYVGETPGTIRVTAESVGHGLVITIIDDGRGMVERTDSPGIGLGLPLMAQLSSHLEVGTNPDGRGTEVRLHFISSGGPVGERLNRTPPT